MRLNSTILSIEQLAFERNHRFLFNQLNCVISPGELLQVRGGNGSGKSTLLRILAGFIEPHHGTVNWRNKSIFNNRDSYQQQLHYIGHQNGVKHHLTVYENLQLNCALLVKSLTPSQLEEVIVKMGLKSLKNTPAGQLSAGQTRRLSLARLLLSSAPLWILDEPTTALDAKGQRLLFALLAEHLATAGIAIVATHQNLLLQNAGKTLSLGESEIE